MKLKISEIEIEPVRPHGGLVAFASFVLNDYLYCSSVGIMTRPDGSYRLCFPTRKIGSNQISIFHPISKTIGKAISDAVLQKYEEVAKGNYDRYSYSQNR